MNSDSAMTGPTHHHYTTIGGQYHALYSVDLFTRIDASYAEQERQMRECMSCRENYDLDDVRAVVANWEGICPNGNAHRVALAVLAERLAEDEAPMKKEDLPLYHAVYGLALRVVAEFPDTEEGAKAANAYMAEHPGIGVLEVVGGRVVLADNEDKGIKVGSPIRRKICTCCAGITRGSQWHNRDDGFGLCNDCIDFCARGATPEGFQRTYGLRGVHFDIQG